MSQRHYSNLPYRCVIAISGKDRSRFLQSLLSNDIQKINPKQAIYSLMLSPQGKYLYDFFIVEYKGRYLIDCDLAERKAILKKFSLYKLHADIVVEDLSETYEVCVLLGEHIFSMTEKHDVGAAYPFCKGIAYIDPRSNKLFGRAFIEKDNHYQSFHAYDYERAELSLYEKLRIAEMIPCGSQDMVSAGCYPYEYFMNDFHAIDYQKGCYVGQEVTARLFHQKKEPKKHMYLAKSTENLLLTEEMLPQGVKMLSNQGEIALVFASKGLKNNGKIEFSSPAES